MIDPKFAQSPYLSKPIGRCSNERRRRSGDSAKAAPNLNSVKKVTASGDASVGSFRSVRSVRTHKTHQPFQQTFGLNSNSARQKQALLLPRETEKLLRSFRQKVHQNGDAPKDQQYAAVDGDSSTICTDDCASLDDRAVFVSINTCQKAMESVFSGPVFAELSLQDTDKKPGRTALPPLTVSSEPDDVSDLESLASKQPETRRKRRTNRRKAR